jgi:hypothetical protein
MGAKVYTILAHDTRYCNSIFQRGSFSGDSENQYRYLSSRLIYTGSFKIYVGSLRTQNWSDRIELRMDCEDVVRPPTSQMDSIGRVRLSGMHD